MFVAIHIIRRFFKNGRADPCEALNEKAQALAVKLYEQAAAAQQAQAGAEGAQATGNAGDDVVDGEFTEK